MARTTAPTGLKVALIGDSGVGKSTILSILLGESFSSLYVKTKDRVVKRKEIRLQNGIKQILQIWDTPGDGEYRTYTTHQVKDVKGIIIVFDVCNEASYFNVQNWMKVINQYVENSTDSIVIIIAANKIDKANYRKIKEEQIQQLAHQHNLQCMEVSAKCEETINKLFLMMATKLAEKAIDQEAPPQPVSEAAQSMEASTQSEKGFFSNCILL